VPRIAKIIECVPNFSEGRNLEKIEKSYSLSGAGRCQTPGLPARRGHNRCVVTVVGEPGPLRTAVLEAMEAAIAAIDMRTHKGQHPAWAQWMWCPSSHKERRHGRGRRSCASGGGIRGGEIHAADFPLRRIRHRRPSPQPGCDPQGQFEGLAVKIRLPEWKPDFGPAEVHPSAGATLSARAMPLVATMSTSARPISRSPRHRPQDPASQRRLRYCKAIGVELKQRASRRFPST